MAKFYGVDISGYDVPIDVTGLTADFVIVKVTEGTQGDRYNRCWRDMLDEGAEGGKLLGVYHYANGKDPVEEADSFYGYIRDYKGRIVPCLDWEGQGNRKFQTGDDVEWCLAFMNRISERMGSSCLLYTSKGICNQYDWSEVAEKYPLWGAEYAYDDYTWDGYPDDPWQSDRPWGAWGDDVTIHQFGYVNPRPNNGGQGCLDGDVFYGTREDWQRMCSIKRQGGGGSMSLREQVVAEARKHLGEPYNSMDNGRRGWGCAMLCCDGALNPVLGTDWYGSVWTFSEGALNHDGEFEFTDDPQPGDVVIYVMKGHDGNDVQDYGHASLYIGDGMCIGSWGLNNIGDADYWPGRGVSEDAVEEQSLGNGWRYVRVMRLDEEIEDEVPDEGQGAVYRLFDERSGAHHWTRSLDEARAVASAGWSYEGVAWRAPSDGGKVYRCYNPSNGDHLLTRDAAEVLRTLDWGWRYEGVCMRSGEGAEVHRLTLPRSGLHFYTADKVELASVRQWMTYEGVAFRAR